jgi:transposase
MILDPEHWMELRRFRPLLEAGVVTIAEIARVSGRDWRTVKKYLTTDACAAPPVAPTRRGTQPRVITPFVGVIDAWLRRDITIRATVIHERLVAEHGFTANYQRVKQYVREARPRIAAEIGAGDDDPLSALHRRFEVLPGAQAQVDWGDEGTILAHVGVPKVSSFHCTLSYSRDPFCCYTTNQDMTTFWDCHRRAFAHFGGVPASIVYDRTKTVVRRHVAPGAAVPLHPQAAAFAAHYGFVIDVLAAYRPTGKGRVERQVDIVRAHVLAGRSFDSIAELDAAFGAWLPIRRGQVHRTHGEVIGVRAEADRVALAPLPDAPYLVADRHLRRVGKDCLVCFEASLYSVPAWQVRAGQRVELRVSADLVAIHALGGDPAAGALLAVHPRAAARGTWVVDHTHWDGLPDGHTRATVIDTGAHPAGAGQVGGAAPNSAQPNPLAALLSRHHAAEVPVARRPLSAYHHAATASHQHRS